MEVEEAIRTRRTHKAYAPEPRRPRDARRSCFELARWAPNHHLTNPWRFRVIGPEALERLKEAAGPEAAPKLDRAPTLVVCSCVLSGDEQQDEEDLHAAAVAAYIVLLAAHARGLAGYWRTPGVLLRARGPGRRRPRPTTSASSACSTSASRSRSRAAPERAPAAAVVEYLR